MASWADRARAGLLGLMVSAMLCATYWMVASPESQARRIAREERNATLKAAKAAVRSHIKERSFFLDYWESKAVNGNDTIIVVCGNVLAAGDTVPFVALPKEYGQDVMVGNKSTSMVSRQWCSNPLPKDREAFEEPMLND
jgi:hypothetical protein